MQWDLCSSAPCVPFYLYTPFHNPMPKPSCQKSRKTKITEKVLLIIQSSNIVHYDQHTQKPACADFQNLFKHFFPVQINIFYFFFIFCQGEFSKQPKISHFVDFDWEEHIEMVWVVHIRVWGMPKSNGAGFVSTISGSWKIKISHFVDFDWEKNMVWVEGFEAWLGFVSMISGSWKIKISGKNFIFCWFWLGKKHQNGLSGAYLGFKACWIQLHRFWVSMISSSWKIKISGKNFTFCWFWLG